MTDAAPAATAATLAPVSVTEPVKLRRKWPLGLWFGCAWLLLILFLTVFADYLPFVRLPTTSVDGAEDYGFGPGADFWFGSDRNGRDVFARCVYAVRISLIISTASIVAGAVIGSALGMLAGYRRGWADRSISIVVDVLLAIPGIILAIVLVGRFRALRQNQVEVLGISFEWLSNTWAIAIVFGLLSIAPISRIVRAQTLSLSQREYVLAARSLGAKTPRVLFREIFPNVVPVLVSVLFNGVALVLAAEAGLAFLGYSVQPPEASWGLMIAENREFIERAWWATLFPCLMLFMTVLAFNLIGDRIARRFDIREATI